MKFTGAAVAVRNHPLRHIFALTAAMVCGGAALTATSAQAAPPARPDDIAAAAPISAARSQDCPGLMVVGVEGTGESTPAANPLVITGMLSKMVGPMLAQGTDIESVTIPYTASFGGAPGTGPGRDPFVNSVDDATARLNAKAADIASRCPHTRIAVAGYSQGAFAAAQFARQVGAGQGPVPPDRVAGVALLSDGSRAPGSGPFPGAPGQVTPEPAPGTSGAATSQVRVAMPPASGGIAPDSTGFGALSGRVGEFCAAGDLACDAPGHAAVLRAAAGLAARADLRDPIAAVNSIGSAWQQTATTATTTVVLNDVRVDRTGVNYVPSKSVSDRVADAADPRTPVAGPDQVQAAAQKVNQIVAAVVADPVRQIPQLAGQVGAAIQANIAANADLLNPSTVLGYADVIGHHTSYGGDGATQQAANWFGALSHDIATAGGRQ